MWLFGQAQNREHNDGERKDSATSGMGVAKPRACWSKTRLRVRYLFVCKKVLGGPNDDSKLEADRLLSWKWIWSVQYEKEYLPLQIYLAKDKVSID